jgi:hypothetical protein
LEWRLLDQRRGLLSPNRSMSLIFLRSLGGCRPADTPIDPNQKLGDDMEGNLVNTA